MGKNKNKRKGTVPEKKKPVVPADATVEIPVLSAEALENGIVIEATQQPPTQEFTAVSEKKEEARYELVRTSSAGYIKACKKFSWYGFHNTHLIVYTMFFLVLSVFAVYYGFYRQDKLLGIFSAIAAAFMLYVIIFGPGLFAGGMAFDEERAEGTLSCGFYKDKLQVKYGTEDYTVPYTSIARLSFIKHYMYIRLKNSKAFPNGIIMEKPVNKDARDGIAALINQNSADADEKRL